MNQISARAIAEGISPRPSAKKTLKEVTIIPLEAEADEQISSWVGLAPSKPVKSIKARIIECNQESSSQGMIMNTRNEKVRIRSGIRLGINSSSFAATKLGSGFSPNLHSISSKSILTKTKKMVVMLGDQRILGQILVGQQ